MTENGDFFPKANRQIDVKALLSHIIQGDGMDKCRICLGDTAQGQVHLDDTVMMDGEKPVTLAELLELVTGVQVSAEEELPSALCLACARAALEAGEYRALVHNSHYQWTNNAQLLQHIASYKYGKRSDRIKAIIANNDIYITDTFTAPITNDGNDNVENDLPLRRVSKQQSCSCPTCGRKFTYPLKLYEHLKLSADLVRACHMCARIMSRNELVKHIRKEHDVETFECQQCLEIFLNRVQLKGHMVKAHSKGDFTCGECGWTFKKAAGYNAHNTVHTASSCPNCDVRFRNHKCYLHHIKTCCAIDARKAVKSKVIVKLPRKRNKELKIGVRGSTVKECICDYCSKKFSGKKFLIAHIQTVHSTETHRPCAQCGKVFASAYMPTHMKSHQKRQFKCEHCNVVLKTKLGFSQHLRLHTGEKPYACKICGELFSASSRRSEHVYNTHRKTERNVKHECKECAAKFRLPHQLKQHVQKVHNNTQKTLLWECDQCRENFSSFRSLVHHKKKHTSVT